MINFVPKEKILEIIEDFCNNKPTEEGLYLTVEGNAYIAVDNSTGDAWTEDFDNITDAIDYLNGKLDIHDYHERKMSNA